MAGVPDVRLSLGRAGRPTPHEHDGGLRRRTPTSRRRARRSRSAPTSRSSRSTPRPARSTPLRHVAVDDCGRILNPLIVAGQQHGGVDPGQSARRCGRRCVYDDARQADHRDLRRLRHPDRGRRRSSLEASNTETPTAGEPARRQGHRRVRARSAPPRPCRTPSSTRSATSASAHRPALHPAAGLARDPAGAGRHGSRACGASRRRRSTGCPTRARARDRRGLTADACGLTTVCRATCASHDVLVVEARVRLHTVVNLPTNAFLDLRSARARSRRRRSTDW